jgi:hypothetical protein
LYQHSAARRFAEEPVPHPALGETPERVRSALRERLTRFVQANREFLGPQAAGEAGRPVPGSRRAEPVTPEQYAWVNEQLGQAERLLFDGRGGCQHCHQEKGAADARPNGLPEYRPSALRDRWFDHAVFSHDSHRMLDCLQCHAGAAASASADDVLLPRIETCRECHATPAGARADCVECHVYHDPLKKQEFQGKLSVKDATRR